ncbi:sugar ABC transporter substrate-binding protein [Streptomyces venezuelae]|uniref:Sugar ABC transporter substrate-binding protein n=1 Tax=Streptomyces venezuelae TaxID=54571 RepID=A0A5P2C589_STRVZ|nr:extracellular solute-binding protein [Streptomyces venezuelae]QES37723.1 sugar ABC transporter substrate-binding protein [Streptomyces venezuelae]
MRRGIAATGLIAALALTAAACGGDDEGSGGSKGGKLSGTVTFWDTSNDAEKGAYEKIAKGFEKLHPDVEVDYVNVPFGEANAKFKNAAGGNSGAPDVMRTEVAWTQDFASLGYLAPLDGTVALDKADDYLPQAAASTKFKGKTYAAPQTIDTLALFYNKKMLKDAGVEVPTSFDEVKSAAKKIRSKSGKTGLYLRGDDPYYYLPYLYGEGGDLLDTKNKKVTVDEPEGAEAFSVMKDLVDSKAAVTDASDGYNNQLNAFKDGDVAMALDGPWSIQGALQGKEFKSDKGNLGVAPAPAGSARQGAPQGGWNLAAYAGSGNLDASYEFIKYMSSAKVQQQTTEQLSLLPTRTSVYDVKSVKDNQMVQFFKPAVAKSVQRPWIPEANALFEPIRLQLEKVLSGKSSPEKGAKGIGDAYRKLLKDYK